MPLTGFQIPCYFLNCKGELAYTVVKMFDFQNCFFFGFPLDYSVLTGNSRRSVDTVEFGHDPQQIKGDKLLTA